MKNIIKVFTISALASLMACEDVETLTPVPATEPSTFTANFLLVNATPDAPALDLFINNVKVGASVASGEGQIAYNTVGITSNAVIANTNIRSRAASGAIGGTLDAADLIYRAGNINTNNFTATNGISYTLFAVDSINRPKPLRTLNALAFGDLTYYSTKGTFTALAKVGGGDTTIYLNVQNFGVDNNPSAEFASNNSVVAFNLVKKYNGNVNPPFMTSLGIVPLGSSDVGGLRYYLWQDYFTTFTPAETTTNAGFRVVNASPNSGALRIRLKFVSGTGANITINATGVPYIMSVTGGLSPSVGSRTVLATGGTNPVNFTTQVIAPAGVPNTYDVEVLDAGSNVLATNPGLTFGGSANPSSNYTFVISGLVGGTGSKALKVTVVEHN
jgi:hypothetical protein